MQCRNAIDLKNALCSLIVKQEIPRCKENTQVWLQTYEIKSTSDGFRV